MYETSSLLAPHETKKWTTSLVYLDFRDGANTDQKFAVTSTSLSLI